MSTIIDETTKFVPEVNIVKNIQPFRHHQHTAGHTHQHDSLQNVIAPRYENLFNVILLFVEMFTNLAPSFPTIKAFIKSSLHSLYGT